MTGTLFYFHKWASFIRIERIIKILIIACAFPYALINAVAEINEMEIREETVDLKKDKKSAD